MGVDPFVALGIDQPQMTMAPPPDGGESIPTMRITPQGKKTGVDPFAALGIDTGGNYAPVAPPVDKPKYGGFENSPRTTIGQGIRGHVIGGISGLVDPLLRLVDTPTYPPEPGPMERFLKSLGPTDVEPTTRAAQLTQAMAGGATDMLFGGPLMGGSRTLPGLAAQAVQGAAGGALGNVAEHAAPEPLKPLAGLVGNMGGAIGAGAGMAGVNRGWQALTEAFGRMGVGFGKQDYNGVRATQSQAEAAGRKAQDVLGPEGQATLAASGQAETEARALETKIAAPETSPADRMIAQKQLQTLQSQRESPVPGAQLTVGQIAPSEKTTGYEADMRTLHNSAFAARDMANNTAMSNAVQGAAPGSGSPEAVATLLRQHLDNIDQMGQQAVTGAHGRVGQATEALGARGTPEAIGEGVRNSLVEVNKAARGREKALWEAIDPEGKLALDLGNVQETARGLLKDITPNLGDALDAKEAQILNGAATLPSVISFKDVSRLWSNIGTAERSLRGTPGNDQSLRRLGILKTAVSGAIADSASAADSGVAERLANLWRGNEPGAGERGGTGVPAGGGAGVGSTGGGGASGAASSERSGNVAGNRGVADAGAGPRPVTATDVIIANGGIKPNSDATANDLQLVHHRAGGRLLNPNGMSHNDARVMLEERGFLRPNSLDNDVIDLLSKPLDQQHSISEAADASIRSGQTRDTSRETHDRFMAGANVSEAVSASGRRLSPLEMEHATELHLQGMHPEEAVQQAARAGEEGVLQRNAEYNAVGAPGVPLAARQAEMPVGRAQLEPNFDAGAAGRYADARASTQERKSTFGQGAIGRVIQPGQQGAPFRVEQAAVPREFLTGTVTEPARVRQYIQAVGGAPQAVANMRDALVSQLRETGIVKDDIVNPKAFSDWFHRHERTIDQFPGLREQLGTVEQAQATLDTVTAKHAQDVRDFQKGAASSFLKDAPEVAVGRMFGSGNSQKTARELYDLVKHDPDALAGLRRGVVEHLDRKFNFPQEADGSAPKSKMFRDYMDQHRNAIKTIMDGQGYQNIERVEGMMDRLAMAKQSEASVGSNTARKLVGAGEHGALGHGAKTTLFAILGEHLAQHASEMLGHAGLIGIASGLVGAGAGVYLATLRRAGIRTMNELGREMMLNPELTRTLMRKVPATESISEAAQRIAASSLRSTLLANQARQSQRKDH